MGASLVGAPLHAQSGGHYPAPKKTSKDETVEEIKPHEYRWEDFDGFVNRYQSKDGAFTVDVSVNYWTDVFTGYLHAGERTDGGVKLEGKADGDSLTLRSKDNPAEATIKAHSGSLSLKTADGRSHTLEAVQVGKVNTFPRPDDAIVLFDETTGLENFRSRGGREPANWTLLEGGIVESIPKTGTLLTKDSFEDYRLYLEFRYPYKTRRNGNSGVFLHNVYEVQILDSFGTPIAPNGSASIYRVSPPATNEAAPPLQWQSFMIDFTAPRFNEQGEKTANARATIWHNGVKVQDDVEIPHPTARPKNPDPKGPQRIGLQDYINYVQFRNIWIQPK